MNDRILPYTGAFGRMESNTAALMKILDSLESQERMVKAMLEDRKKQLNGKSKPQPGLNQLAESTAQVLNHDPPPLQFTTANTCRERCTGNFHPLVNMVLVSKAIHGSMQPQRCSEKCLGSALSNHDGRSRMELPAQLLKHVLVAIPCPAAFPPLKME